MLLHLSEVRYSCVSKPFLDGIQPYEHQVQTLEAVEQAIANRATTCIFNTSITGGGKTLAAYAYSILHQNSDYGKVIGIYPTNELIRDQKQTLEKHWGPNTLFEITSEEIQQLREEFNLRNSPEVLERFMIHWGKAILTNPDILYMLMFQTYPQVQGFTNHVFEALMEQFPVFVFDEFHLYDVKQLGAIAFMVGMTKYLASHNPHVFIFSSATPQEDFQKYIQTLSIPIVHIQANPSPTGRVVVEPITLELIEADLDSWEGLENMQKNEAATLKPYLQQYPQARGVILLDSLYDAKSYAQELSETYDVGEVHGFIDATDSSYSLEKQITVGTSAIEVGIDFVGKKAKDFLCFEARSSSQFLQRLGRLGRRGRNLPLEKEPYNYAVAYIPKYVHKYLEEQQVEQCTKRTDFGQLLQDAYIPTNQFKNYFDRYAPVEACYAFKHILRHELEQEPTRQALKSLVQTLYGVSLETTLEHCKKLEREKTLAGLLTFRGGTIMEHLIYDKDQYKNMKPLITFEVPILDLSDQKKGRNPLRTYDLIFVLRRTDCQLVTKERFMQEVSSIQHPEKQKFLDKIAKQNPICYVIISNLLEKSRKVWFRGEYQSDIGKPKVRRIGGLSICTESCVPVPGMKKLNDELEEREAICWISKGNPFDLAHKRHLPPLFKLYPLEIARNSLILSGYTIAFDLNAFFMDSLLGEHSSGAQIY